MISNVSRASYKHYRPSGIEWVGDVPAHWEVRPLKHWLGINEKVLPEATDPEYEFLYLEIADTGTGVLTDRPTKIQFGAAPSRARRLVRSGDTIVSTVRTYLKAVWFTDKINEDLVCSTGFVVFTPRKGIAPKFVSYMAQSSSFTDRVMAESVGIAYPAISEGRISSFKVCVPPLGEQTAIVRYLDAADGRIQRYISAKVRLVELLTEQKQAVISQAVTRGLDPNVPLKPSGVEWLGDVPAHWEVAPIKRAFASMDYGISESASNFGSIRLITMGHVSEGRVAVPHSGGVDAVEVSLLLQDGDLLFNRTNSQELVGKVGLFEGHDTPVTFASYLVRLRPNSHHRSEYLNAVLNAVKVLSIVRREAIPSLHQSNLNPTRYGRIRIPLPPLNEQIAIMKYLEKVTGQIDVGINRARRQIELMREYRTRLIADVVTGKLDVRGAVADEIEMPTP